MKKKTPSTLIKTSDQAKIAFQILLEEQQREELISGVFKLIEKSGNPEIDRLLDHYEDFIQNYDLKDLLYGHTEVMGASSLDTQTAAILSCLLALIAFSAELRDPEGKMIPVDDIPGDHLALQAIQYITRSMDLPDLMEYLLHTVISIVGLPYYTAFHEKMGSKDFTKEELLALEDEEEWKEHIDLMAWFALMRLFLESIYVYFNSANQNPKNALL